MKISENPKTHRRVDADAYNLYSVHVGAAAQNVFCTDEGGSLAPVDQCAPLDDALFLSNNPDGDDCSNVGQELVDSIPFDGYYECRYTEERSQSKKASPAAIAAPVATVFVLALIGERWVSTFDVGVVDPPNTKLTLPLRPPWLPCLCWL